MAEKWYEWHCEGCGKARPIKKGEREKMQHCSECGERLHIRLKERQK